jgi:YVTN family beta-propeller protein
MKRQGWVGRSCAVAGAMVLVALVALVALFVLGGCGGGGGDGDEAAAAASSAAQKERQRQHALAVNQQQAALARWSAPVNLSLVPVAGAALPDGKLLFWSAEERFSFGAFTGRTYTSIFDPATNTASERLVNETGYDMFCPGTTNLPDGRILVGGGLDSALTSIYDPATNTWARDANMNIPRGYQANTLLADGSVFTLGGSWSGGVGNKHGEVWTAGSGWRRLPGVPVDSMLGIDSSRNFGGDSHMWLIPTANGRVLYAGPSVNMQWISTTGDGAVQAAGVRGDDTFSVNGTAVMYDTGKILKLGGAAGYEGFDANANAFVIDTNGGFAVRRVASMAYRRAFHNSVVLPTGQVVVIGGQTFEQAFTDNNSVLAPEIFDPETETFTTMPAMTVPRNYHSIGLLLPDGRVLAGGGGLCGACNANHADVQILSPHYLFNADGSAATRPQILTAPASFGYGSPVSVTTDSPIASFAMVRMGSTTHTVNNDQRRIAVSATATGNNTYRLAIPSNPGILLPGHWMLFAMNAQGTPSVATVVRVDQSNTPRLVPVADPASVIDVPTSIALVATDPQGSSLTFSATGLPAGMVIDAATGRISGTPLETGRFVVTVSASNGSQTVSTEFTWVVSTGGLPRYAKLEALSEVAGNPWTSMAEFNLLDANGQPIVRSGWAVSADSAETVSEFSPPSNAIDGNASTFWHTQWGTASPPPPHSFVVDMGAQREVSGFRYLPRPGGGNGTIAQYRFYLSRDGIDWGVPVAQGSLAELGANAAEKTVLLNNVSRGKAALQSSDYSATTLASLAVDGNTDGAFNNGSITHTLNQANAWWEVDLGTPHLLQGVRLWNRSDCCADRLTNFYVFVSDAPMAGRTLAALLADPAVKRVAYPAQMPRTDLLMLGISGRHLRVQLNTTNFLQLAEVQVFGRAIANRAPTVSAPSVTTIEQGQTVTQPIAASDPDGDTLRFAATGLPPGLAIDTTSGIISGTATSAGSFNVIVTATDPLGASGSAAFVWSVLQPLPILGPIAAAPVLAGGTVSYNPTVGSGSPAQYSWDFGDGSAATPWADTPQTTHGYTLPGVYSVTLTTRSPDGRTRATSFLQAIYPAGSTATLPRASSSLAIEPRAGSSPRLWVANPDNDSVSVIDTATNLRLAELPVGASPRSVAIAADGRVWVTNKASATISVIDAAGFVVVQTIVLPRASQPHGIVISPADGRVFVSLEATGIVVPVTTAGPGTGIAVGANPRELAISADGTRLFVSRFITPPQPGEATANVQTVDGGGALVGGEVRVVNTTTMAIERSVVLRHSDRPDTTLQGRGVPNYIGAAAISPNGQTAWVPSKQDNLRRGTLRDGSNLDFQNTVRAVSSKLNLATLLEDPAARIDHDNAGLASAAVFHPTGAYLFVALETSRQVAVIDAAGGRELFRIEVGLAPQALALPADGLKLYVHNFMERTVSAIDLLPLLGFGDMRAPQLARPNTVGVDKLAANVLKGKQLFYDARDPRLSRDSYMSCAACHNDGGHDGRTWDFTGLGEGLRNTISLRGRSGAQGFLHWSANFDEAQDFEAQIRNLAQGSGLMSNAAFNTGTRSQPLGDRKAGLSADLDALAAYMASFTTFSPSPARNADGSLSAAAAAGKTLFASLNCAACHAGVPFTISSDAASLRNVGSLKASSGQRLSAPLSGIDPPTLRDAWATAPYLHDGSAATLAAAIGAHTTLGITSAQADSLAAYVREIGSEEASAPVGTNIGTGLRGQYFASNNLTGNAVLTRTEAIDFAWGSGAPGAGVPADNFSVRWTGWVEAPAAGSYMFQTLSDDGVRVWVNGALVVNNWTAHSPTLNTSSTITLAANQRAAIMVEYQEFGGGATMSLRWLPPGGSSSAYSREAGTYFANVNLTGSPVLSRTEAVDFNWATGSPGSGVPADNFSARWTGWIESPATGGVALRTQSDAGVRVWVDGVPVIDNWTAHSASYNMALPLAFNAGQRRAVTVEFKEQTGNAVMRLQWQAPGTSGFVAIPANRLYATAP